MSTNILLIIIGGVAAAMLPALLVGISGIVIASRARREASEGSSRADALELRLGALDTALADEQRRTTTLAGELEQLNLQLGRVDGNAVRMGLREAIALSRRGADAHELVATCGIGYGEARLIGLLHGQQQVDGSAPELN